MATPSESDPPSRQLQPVTLDLSGERVIASYALTGTAEEARQTAEHLRVEQTIEFPADLVPDDDIQRHLIASIEDLQAESVEGAETGRHIATISFAAEVSGFEGPQFLNMLLGNISLVPGVRLLSVELPPSVLASLPGPRFGLPGLRERLKAPKRPLLATALKPMGTPLPELVRMAEDFVAGGLDIIKDDHGFANQPYGPFVDRVEAIANAVNEANARYDRHCLYLPSMNVPFARYLDSAFLVMEAGAAGFMVMAGLHGFDAMQALASDDDLGGVVMAHPSLLGSFVADPNSGMSHSMVFGTLPRLFGADISVFPSFGGRFSFSRDECLSIAGALAHPSAPAGSHQASAVQSPGPPSMPSAVAAPAGGISVENASEVIGAYGTDVCLLVGGSLHRGDRRDRAKQMREAAELSVS